MAANPWSRPIAETSLPAVTDGRVTEDPLAQSLTMFDTAEDVVSAWGALALFGAFALVFGRLQSSGAPGTFWFGMTIVSWPAFVITAAATGLPYRWSLLATALLAFTLFLMSPDSAGFGLTGVAAAGGQWIAWGLTVGGALLTVLGVGMALYRWRHFRRETDD